MRLSEFDNQACLLCGRQWPRARGVVCDVCRPKRVEPSDGGGLSDGPGPEDESGVSLSDSMLARRELEQRRFELVQGGYLGPTPPLRTPQSQSHSSLDPT